MPAVSFYARGVFDRIKCSPLAFSFGKTCLRVQVEEDKRNSEQRSQQRLDDAEHEASEVKRLSFRACCERARDGVRMWGSGRLLKIMPEGRPLRSDIDREHEGRPNGKKKNAPPERATKPGTLAAAARELLTLAQCAGGVRFGKNSELLPKEEVDEQPSDDPNLKSKNSEHEQDRQQGKRPAHDHPDDYQRKRRPKKVSAINKNAEQGDARPEFQHLTKKGENSRLTTPDGYFSGYDLNAGDKCGPRSQTEEEHAKGEHGRNQRPQIGVHLG